MIAVSESADKWLQSVDAIPARLREPPHRGRPYVYPASVVLRCYLLMLIYPPVRNHSALHRFLTKHSAICRLVGLSQVPHRTTFSRRFRSMEADLRARIWVMGLAFILYGYVELHVLIADGTLHHAAGPSWPAKYQQQGIVPKKLRHVDRQAGWGKSPYHGWVWGYRTHPVVALTPQGEPIPILAQATSAAVQDNTILLEQLPWLPPEATVLLLDSSYEDQALVEAWEQRDAAGLLTRWMVVDPKKRPGRANAWRQRMQVWRNLEEKELYSLRGQLIEPFFGRWKDAFDLARLPLQGAAARAYQLLALYGYQLLIWNNLRAGRPTYAYQHLVLGSD